MIIEGVLVVFNKKSEMDDVQETHGYSDEVLLY